MRPNKFELDLRRNQVDRTIAQLKKLQIVRPQKGWIKTAREILGMTQRQLAARMSITPPSLLRLEKAEIDGSTTLKSIDRAAAAMHCKLVYMLVPEEETFGDLLEKQALNYARRTVESVSTSMLLENQGVDAEVIEREIRKLAIALIEKADKRIWEQSR